ncbi:MAG: tRNA threonylcarbamoyladenosine dehydratase [Microbacter sp.]
MQEDPFHRTSLILGEEAMQRLAEQKVILFGIGGVGSWCAEALIRSGITNLTIVDSDQIEITNINRQLHATSQTIGKSKTEVMAERLKAINPHATIKALHQSFSKDTLPQFQLDQYDVIIDAIDRLADKVELILAATATKAYFVSSMGAAWRTKPERIRTAEFWKVQGCPLAAALRNHFRKKSMFPTQKFQTVYSDEPIAKHTEKEKGSLVHITAIFGLTLASLVITHWINKPETNSQNTKTPDE